MVLKVFKLKASVKSLARRGENDQSCATLACTAWKAKEQQKRAQLFARDLTSTCPSERPKPPPWQDVKMFVGSSIPRRLQQPGQQAPAGPQARTLECFAPWQDNPVPSCSTKFLCCAHASMPLKRGEPSHSQLAVARGAALGAPGSTLA